MSFFQKIGEKTDNMEFRLSFIIIVFSILVFIGIGRIGYLQIINPGKYADNAAYLQHRDLIVPAKRGSIYDCNGKELAVAVKRYDVSVEKMYIGDEKEYFAERVGKVLNIPKKEILDQLDDERERFILKKSVDIGIVDQLKNLPRYSEEYIQDRLKQNKIDETKAKNMRNAKIKGLYYDEKVSRYYPYGKFASYVIGHTSADNVGQSGIEGYFNDELSGVPGRKIVLADAKNVPISDDSLNYNPPVDGYDVTLTIDEVVQHYVERALEKSHKENESKNTMAIVMDSKSGDILAMCSKPDFDPNKPSMIFFNQYRNLMKETEFILNPKEKEEAKIKIYNLMWRNPMVSDAFEPGSIFKTITGASALEEGVIDESWTYNDNSAVEIDGMKINNSGGKHYGKVGIRTATAQSINTFFIQLGLKLGSQNFHKYIHAFGFGQKTGIPLTGEATGILYPVDKTGKLQLATMSFGQSISVTPIQMITAVNAIANDGKLMRPRLVKQITDKDGNVIERFDPEIVRRPISKETAHSMLDLMETVVSKGGGKKARIKGYHISGKTGTAQKLVDGVYGKGHYVSSFVAVAPMENPQFTVLVMKDEPSGNIYGGSNCAPIAKMILKDLLIYKGITAKTEETYEVKKSQVPELRQMTYSDAKKALYKVKLNAKTDMENPAPDLKIVDTFPKSGESIAQGASVILYFEGQTVNNMMMPDLQDKTVEEVNRISQSLGLKLNFSGTGKVVKQTPKPDTPIKPGANIYVEFLDESSVENDMTPNFTVEDEIMPDFAAEPEINNLNNTDPNKTEDKPKDKPVDTANETMTEDGSVGKMSPLIKNKPK